MNSSAQQSVALITAPILFYLISIKKYYLQIKLNKLMQEINTSAVVKQQPQEEGINPVQSAINGDIFPLIAAFDHLDFNTLINPQTPLSHYICSLYIPLETILGDRVLPMNKNIQGKTPLSFAIKARDALATYYCLKQPHEVNTRSTDGLTPAMQALRSGFKLGFLLCVHFGHITNDLANVAAEINDIWALKFLKGMNVPLNQTDLKGQTPLQTAVASYSYESIDYLAKLYPKDIKMDKLGKLAKSKTIFSNLKQIKNNSNSSPGILSFIKEQSFLKQTSLLITLFFLVNTFPMFQQPLYLNLTLLLHLCFIIFYFNSPVAPPKPLVNILKTVEPFIKGQLPQICPICVQIKNSNVDHCVQCGVCIQGFHFHDAVCVSKCNQLRWVSKEIIWMIVLNVILGDFVQYFDGKFTSSWKFFQTFSLLYNQSAYYRVDFILYAICFLFYLKQILSTVVIIYVILSGKTYQQVFHSQRYQTLYKPIMINGQHYSKPLNTESYTIKARLRKTLSNTIKFIFG